MTYALALLAAAIVALGFAAIVADVRDAALQ